MAVYDLILMFLVLAATFRAATLLEGSIPGNSTCKLRTSFHKISFATLAHIANYHVYFEGTGEKGQRASDILYEKHYLPAAEDLVCVSICHQNDNIFGGDSLVLVVSKASSGEYERIGVMCSPRSVDLFKDAKECFIEIV